nr:MAG TPA: hypothetical protein [Caudoviricetes sp.]
MKGRLKGPSFFCINPENIDWHVRHMFYTMLKYCIYSSV